MDHITELSKYAKHQLNIANEKTLRMIQTMPEVAEYVWRDGNSEQEKASTDEIGRAHV